MVTPEMPDMKKPPGGGFFVPSLRSTEQPGEGGVVGLLYVILPGCR